MLAACLKVRAKDRPQSIQQVREILQENVISEPRTEKKSSKKEPSVKKRKEIKSSPARHSRSESPASPNYGMIGLVLLFGVAVVFFLEIWEMMRTVKLFSL